MKEYTIIKENGTEIENITEREAQKIIDTAIIRQSSIAMYEYEKIEAVLVVEDPDDETIEYCEHVAVKMNGTWYYLPKAYR